MHSLAWCGSAYSAGLRRRAMDRKVECPYCGYKMPLTHTEKAVCRGVFIRCKGRNCKKIFEIRIDDKTK